MPVTQIVASALRGATARCRAAGTFRRAAFLLGAIGMIAGAAVTAALPAVASVGSDPGNLKFSPASGASTSQPTWSTTDACPAGYQGSAEIAIFAADGRFLSFISNVAYNVNSPFHGELDGKMSAILKFASVPKGGSLDFTVGCYTGIGGTGRVRWMQSAQVNESSSGTSYTTSAPSGSAKSASGPGALGTGRGKDGAGAPVSNTSAAGASASGGLGTPALAGLIAAACALAAGAAGYVWYRRRDRSRLM